MQVKHTHWGIIAKGTREMLVHHEFARDGLFPGDAGAQGRQRHTDTDPAELACNRWGKAGLITSI